MNDYERLQDDIRDHLYGSGRFNHTNNDALEHLQKKYNHLQYSQAYRTFKQACSLLEDAMLEAEAVAEQMKEDGVYEE